MSIPDFNQYGLLPDGIHICSLHDVQNKLTWTDKRSKLFERLTIFLNTELLRHFPVETIYLDGSFVTDKDCPDDTDIVLDLTQSEPAICWNGLQYMQQNQMRIKQDFDVDFWVSLPGNNDFVQYFSYLLVLSLQK
jgi:hypothetical protein